MFGCNNCYANGSCPDCNKDYANLCNLYGKRSLLVFGADKNLVVMIKDKDGHTEYQKYAQ